MHIVSVPDTTLVFYGYIFILFKLVILNISFYNKPIHLSSFMSLNIEVFTMIKHQFFF